MPPSGPRRFVSRAALGAWLVTVAAGSLVGVLGRPDAVGGSPVERIGWATFPILFTALGALIAVRSPGNRISRILFLVGLALLADNLLQAPMASAPAAVTPWTFLLVLLASSTWLGVFIPLFHLLYVFPDGRLPSSRWRWVPWIEASVVTYLLGVGLVVQELGPPSDAWTIDNPIGIEGFEFSGPVAATFTVALFTILVGGVAAIVLRWRRSGDDVRHQIKWVLAAFTLFAAVYTAAFWTESETEWSTVQDIALTLGVAVIPISITAAILRYRLFDIDRILSRTVTYALLAGTLAAVYGGGVAILTDVLSASSDLAVAASTLAAVTLFDPLRRRLRRAVDRRFDRTRYDTERELSALSGRLQGFSSTGAVASDVATVVQATLRPSSIEVWIREPR